MDQPLNGLAEEISSCRLCPLWQGRTHAVPGEGAFGSLFLVGEAPGQKEDELGRPFVGRAGRLLEKALLAVGLSRREVYITNVVKCRPPANRRPKKSEIRACLPYLSREVAIIKPQLMLLLGNTAADAILGQAGLSSLRGKKLVSYGIETRVTYHPAAVLRNPALRPLFFADLREASQRLRGQR
ncbi:MAG: uracil-DNA glycosylase [Thermoprotei archaeon]|nr:uracil-DNA glycosylase [TACK group archaeon]